MKSLERVSAAEKSYIIQAAPPRHLRKRHDRAKVRQQLEVGSQPADFLSDIIFSRQHNLLAGFRNVVCYTCQSRCFSYMKLKIIFITLALVSFSLQAQDWMEKQKTKDRERAAYWAERGYRFDASYMTAWSMDQKVKDTERAKYWKAQGYTFDANHMTAWSMDQKVKDIERAKYWNAKGYTFDANYMTAWSMDNAAFSAGALQSNNGSVPVTVPPVPSVSVVPSQSQHQPAATFPTAGYPSNHPSQKISVPSSAPSTVQLMGNIAFDSNGGTTQRIGNTYFHSDGTTTQKIGETFFHSDGGTTQRMGNFQFHSDGTTTQKIGNTYFHSDGSSSQQIGNLIFNSN